MERLLKGEDAMRLYVQEFLLTLQPGELNATVVGLSGDLGSGKTTFVKFLAQGLHIEEHVVSPTYVIAKFYDIKTSPSWRRLVHVDAYRIEDPEEFRALKWEDITKDPKNLIMIEWPEKMKELFPRTALTLQFQFINETTRAIMRGRENNA